MTACAPLPPVSVALAVSCANPALFAASLGCIRTQTLRDLDIMLLLNGSDDTTSRAARDFAVADERIRIFTLHTANLAAALNLGLREARHELVARMDADDLCAPSRLEVQSRYMTAHPSLAVLGTWYNRIDEHGITIGEVRTPFQPATIRWRLLLENTFCHGSVMMRRSPVLGAGGYDESCEKAQDYDLWLRLARLHPLANLPEPLYTHRARADRGTSATPAQASNAARALLRAWHKLPDQTLAPETALAAAHAGSPDAAELAESHLDRHGPSRDGLLTYLLAHRGTSAAATGTMETCRRSRLREVGAAIATAGASELFLWGAGAHTRWVLHHTADLGLKIRGIVDDSADAPDIGGFETSLPRTLPPGSHVLLSSDWHEEALWRSSTPHRARGVKVWRLYGDNTES